MTRRLVDEKYAKARRLRATGMPPRHIATMLKVSEAWVKKATKDIRPGSVPAEADEPAPETPRELPPPPPAPPPEPPRPKAVDGPRTAEGALQLAYQSYDDALELARKAKEDGNTSAAARAQGLMQTALDTIRKLQKGLEQDTDTVSWPRDAHARAMQSVRERVQALCNVPLQCPDCGRELRVRLASEGSKEGLDAIARMRGKGR